MEPWMMVLMALVKAGVCAPTPPAQIGPVQVQVISCAIVQIPKPVRPPMPETPDDREG